MKFSIALLIYEMKKSPCAPEIIFTALKNEHLQLSGIRILCEESYQNDILYISAAEHLQDFIQLPSHLMVAGLLDDKKDGIVYLGTSMQELLNAINSIMAFYLEIETELVSAISRNESLRAVLSICARYFDNPITLCDERYRLIEISDNCVNRSLPQHFKYVLEHGRIDPNVPRLLKAKDLDRKLSEAKDTSFVCLEDIPTYYFNKNIFNERGAMIATLAVHDSFCPLDVGQTVIVEQVSQIIRNFVFNSSRNMPTVISNIERIIFDILNGTSFDKDVHGVYFRQIHWGLTDGFYVIRAEVSSNNTSSTTIRYAFLNIHSLFPDSLIVEMGNIAAVIICQSQIRYSLKNAFSDFSEYLGKENGKAAVSMLFRNIGEIRDNFNAAAETLKLGRHLNPDEDLYFCEKYTLQTLFALSGTTLDLRVFCRPEALALYDYDKNNGTEFFLTLYTYLLRYKSQQAAAKNLHIHRNTLTYRLNRITEICGVDVVNNIDSYEIILAYRILEFIDGISPL